MSKWDQYAVPAAPAGPAPRAGSKWDQYAVPASGPEPKPEEPGWFQPGSRSEAFVRGASQAATLGFGDEIQALIRTLGSDRTYRELRNEERGANDMAAQANPGTYLAGGVVAGLPAGYAGLTKSAGGLIARQGAIGGVQGAGNSREETVGGVLSDAGMGAGAQAATAGVVRGVGNLPKLKRSPEALAAARASPKGQLLAQRTKEVKAAQALAQSTGKNDVRNAAVGGIIGPMFFGTSVEAGAAAGVAFARGANPTAKVLGKAVPAVARGAVKAAGMKGPAGAVNATALALRNMSGQEAQTINDDVRAQIDEQAAQGRPVYAATFQALNASPAYRVASEKVLQDDLGEDEEE